MKPTPPGGSPADPRAGWRAPWVQLKTFSYHPTLYPAMIRGASPDAKAGDLVSVYDKDGQPFGAGFYHPRARVPLRVLHHGIGSFTEADLLARLDRAVDLRLQVLNLPATTNAFRVVHSDADALSGLVVDKFHDVLSLGVHSLAVAQRLPSWLPHLHQRLGTRSAHVQIDERAARLEGIATKPFSKERPRPAKIEEHGIRFEVDFEDGHKTGFFCDQRENRRHLASFCAGKRVLDLCCYTGGFSLAAKVLGKAEEVTGVDLDEDAIRQAQRNGNINQTRIQWVHCDAFTWARQMQRNAERWDVVIVDPPKLVFDREDTEGGMKKYEDLNTLAISLLRPDGLLVSCSCSGMLPAQEFEHIVIRAAHRHGKRLQILEQTGAAPDHPVLSTCPESRYLKVLWSRVIAA